MYSCTTGSELALAGPIFVCVCFILCYWLIIKRYQHLQTELDQCTPIHITVLHGSGYQVCRIYSVVSLSTVSTWDRLQYLIFLILPGLQGSRQQSFASSVGPFHSGLALEENT